MIFKKVKNIVDEFRARDENQKRQNNEIIWANIFHDTIKDRVWLKSLSLSPGRWAADYSFLYILVRALSDCKPKRIIEFGLGETSKVVSSFLENDLKDTEYTILEQDKNWIDIFKNKFNLSSKVELIHLPLQSKEVKGFPVNSYKGIEENVSGVYDLYVVDAPFGSPRYSRFDICTLAESLHPQNEFIIIIDDFNRIGEKDTAKLLVSNFKERGFKIYSEIFSGIKSQFIITSEKYKHLTTI